MWSIAYNTINRAVWNNPFTAGQCGGMSALWLANMYKRRNMRSLAETKPDRQISLDTHLAGLHVPAKHYFSDSTGKRHPNMERLSLTDADMRYLASAGLKPGPAKSAHWEKLSGWLAQVGVHGGYLVNVGGHDIATFVVWKDLARFEKKKRLYYFDPNHGCYFSEDELSFRLKFLDVIRDCTNPRNPNPKYSPSYWLFYKVYDVSTEASDDADIDISSLFAS